VSHLPIVRLFGFEIRIHVSWAIIVAVLAVTVAAQVGSMEPDTSQPIRWVIGGFVAVSLLVSAILHELGHALVARRVGVPPGPVVVYFFGAAADPSLITTRPRAEIAVALAGPAVSLAIAAVLLLAASAMVTVGPPPVQVAGDIALVIGALNLLLGLFNLLPAFPLDGGRVVRGLAWARTGSAGEGLRAAAWVGRGLGIILAIVGIGFILLADSVDGLMVALCGWFLISTAGGVKRQALLDALIGDLRAGEVMDTMVQGVPPGLTIDTFAARVLDGTASSSLPVVRGPDLLGMIGAAQLRRVRPDRWATTRAEDLMVGPPKMPVVDSQTPIRAVLDSLQRSGLDGLPVVDGGALAGVVTRRGVAEALRLRTIGHGAAPG
jgi:Zn-dependent protease/predicted transcriptional regulator